MNRKDARLRNLQRLVDEYKTIAAVASASGTSEKYLGQLLNGSTLKSGKPRQIGDDLAQRLEDGCGKPHGWMDADHDTTAPIGGPTLTMSEAELLRLYRAASPEKRRAMLAVARL